MRSWAGLRLGRARGIHIAAGGRATIVSVAAGAHLDLEGTVHNVDVLPGGTAVIRGEVTGDVANADGSTVDVAAPSAVTSWEVNICRAPASARVESCGDAQHTLAAGLMAPAQRLRPKHCLTQIQLYPVPANHVPSSFWLAGPN